MKKILIMVAMLALFACSNSNDVSQLVGTYGLGSGKNSELFKVEKASEGIFTLYEFKGGEWKANPIPLTPLAETQKAAFGKNGKEVIGLELKGKNFAILKVAQGWSMGDFTSKTGYWVASMFGPLELHKEGA